MIMRRLSLGVLATLLATGVAFAQPKPVTQTPAPSVVPSPTKPVTTAGTATPPAKVATSSVPSGSPVNLNTATPQQLDVLPDVGASRSKAIVAERGKGKFKDWGDFATRMAHTSVNKGVQSKIKDHVTF